jgi:hypothetical protein
MLPGYHGTAAAAVPFFSRILETKAADQFGSLPSLHVTWALWVAVPARRYGVTRSCALPCGPTPP